MADKLTPAYRLVMNATTPMVKWWGRLKVEGLEHLPESGPVLLAGNHDSYWDPIAIGMAGRSRRQIRALAKSTMWGNKLVGKVLDGMGQIPIERGKADEVAMTRAIEELRKGACIGIFPEGTRSLGRELRARSGFGRLAEAVPEAQIVCCSVQGTVGIPAVFPRPDVRVRFWTPAGGGLQQGETAGELSARLLAEIRAEAPIAIAGRSRRKAAMPT
jgi:1-acyl-sn-glycerol-3-phosphate acyltransferase